MARKVRELLVAAAAASAMLFAGTQSPAQQTLPPAPIPAVPSGPGLDATLIVPPRAPEPTPPHAYPDSTSLLPLVRQGPPVVPPGPAPPNGPVGGPPPLLMPPPPPEPLPRPPAVEGRWYDRCNYPPSGWFAGIQIDVVGPHVKNRLVEDVPFSNGLVDTVHLPSASLDWTASPRFELGYRFAGNAGQFSAVYRLLSTDGRATMSDFDPGTVTTLHSSLEFNVLDLAYGSGYFAPGPYCDLQYSIGVRIAQAFFDSRAEDVIREVRTSNHFFGAGPLAALEWQRRLNVPGLAVYSRLEGAVPLGRIHQGFEEVFKLSNNTNFGSALSQHQTQAIPTLSFDFGLGWTPQWSRFSRFSAGYHIERWWELGEVNNSSADVTTQGFFFKGEFSY
jgi:hypothetical protein